MERSNFVSKGSTKVPLRPPSLKPKEFVLIVDAFSTGACIAYEALQRGYGLIHCLSLEPSDELAGMVPAHLRGALPWATTLYVDTKAPIQVGAAKLKIELGKFLQGKTLKAVIAGAETGVKLADFLSKELQQMTNGTRFTEARRNKAEMGEAVRKSGVRAVRQLKATTWDPVKKWLGSSEWNLNADDPTAECLLIVKPLESAGSDGVTACHKVGDVPKAIEKLVGAVNGLGLTNEGVLVQEFLQGTEYVIDTVSRNSQHKVAAIWEYDRRPTNGAGFVLHGQKLLPGTHPVVEMIVPYAEQVLDALEVKHGPSHMEVKLTPHPHGRDGLDPCLVEVGARCHGAEGFWMSTANSCCGYNQAVAALDSFIDPDRFTNLPALPPSKLLNAGCLKYLLVHQTGTLQGVDADALKTITQLPSYQGHEIFLTIGKPVIPTQNCFSWGGVVKMANPTDDGLQHDYDIIERLCLNGLWRIA